MTAQLALIEAEAAYLRQGLEVATHTEFVDLESVHAHARYILESCDGGRLMLERFRHQVERAEAAERERDELLAKLDHIRIFGRCSNGLTDKDYRRQLQEYVEGAFFDSPTVASLNEQITRLIESRVSVAALTYDEFIDRVRAAMHDVRKYGSKTGTPDLPHLAGLAESIIPDIFFNICEAYRRGWADKESGKKGQQVNSHATS